MNTANKPVLAEALWEMTEKPIPSLLAINVLYLLDGIKETCSASYSGRRVKRSSRFSSINYVNGDYEENAKVVFDGYSDEPTTKDSYNSSETHQTKKRNIGKVCLEFQNANVSGKISFKQGK